MAGGAIVASQTGKPNAAESKEMVRLLNGINKKFTNVMQGSVQMVRVNACRRKTHVKGGPRSAALKFRVGIPGESRSDTFFFP